MERAWGCEHCSHGRFAVHNAQAGNNLGISGTFNHNGNDGTIARFGWKAQNKSLDLFSGEPYNVEMGISNETFPQDPPLPGEDFLGNGLPANGRVFQVHVSCERIRHSAAHFPTAAPQAASGVLSPRCHRHREREYR
jgi:hypothetical protein